ncbi:MAG: hypothetical protein EA385_12980 [Salinarimonadaceae bacterium]|nr:MAG: hypothetical protein EA385_12980 [Salinarimonadaceae bacterium]
MFGQGRPASPIVAVADARSEPVLLVSMRRDLRLCLRDGLTAAGFIVDAQASGVGGLSALREAQPPYGWLVCDLVMHGMIDGGRLAYEYRFQRPQRRALLLCKAMQGPPPPEGEYVEPEPGAVAAAIARMASEETGLDGVLKLCFR